MSQPTQHAHFMDSALQQAIVSIQQRDYAALVILTAVGYDYILTFTDEVEYVWKQRWTVVSTLFVLVRYIGFCTAITCTLDASSFVPGPVEVYVSMLHLTPINANLEKLNYLASCDLISTLYRWTIWIFISAAEYVMILRVWALYGQAKYVLVTLLPFYVTEVAVYLAVAIQISARFSSLAIVRQLSGFTPCLAQFTPSIILEIADVAQLILGGLMCLFTALRYIRESRQVHLATTTTQPNRYMKLLTREGTVYFLAIILLALIDFLTLLNISTGAWWTSVWCAVPEYVPVLTLVPRFILSLRALHARDVQGRHGSGIDTAFGSASVSGPVVNTIVFADAEQHEASQLSEEIVLEEREARDSFA